MMTIEPIQTTAPRWLLVLFLASAIGMNQIALAEDILIKGEYRPAKIEDAKTRVKTLPVPFDESQTHEVQFGSLTAAERLRIAYLPRTGPKPIGIHRKPSLTKGADITNPIAWQLVERGWTGTVTVSSAEATSVRLQLRVETIGPTELTFFQFDQLGELVVLDTVAMEPQNSGDRESSEFTHTVEPQIIWSPTATGTVIGINILAPNKQIRDNVSITITKLAHRFESVMPFDQKSRHMDSETSILNPQNTAACENEEIACHQGSITTNAANASAMISYEKSTLTYFCSAVLINDTAPGTQHYIVTALHCIDSDTVAGTVEGYWFYQTATCVSLSLDDRYQRTSGGATLVASNSSADLALLNLKTAPPSTAYYAGISTASSDYANGSILDSYHHPSDTKRYARLIVDRIADVTFCDENGTNCETFKNLIVTNTQVGLVGPGSSGSGLFKGSSLVALLQGGPTTQSCGGRADSQPISKSYSVISPHINPPATTPQTPTVSFGSRTSSHSETAGTVTVSVSVSPQPTSSLDVTFTVGGTASSSDFSTTSNTRVVSFSANSSSADIAVSVVNDSFHETNETVILTLVDGTDYDLGTDSTHTLTILDNDAVADRMSLSVSPIAIAENAGATAVTVTATITGPTRWPTAQSVLISVDDSGTTNTVGFSPVGDFNLVIPSGSATGSASFSLVPTSDNVDSRYETVTVSGTLAGVTISSTNLRLLDDDDAPTSISLTATPTTISEGSSATTVSVTATVDGTNRWGSSQTIAISVAGSGASNVVSFMPVSGFNLSIPSTAGSGGGTFSLSPVNDRVQSNNETITISGSLSGVVVKSTAITLTDDDQSPDVPVLTIVGGTGIDEGGSASFTVTANPLPSTTLTANLLIANTANSDFLSESAKGSRTLAIPVTGESTFSVSALEDDIDEANGGIVATVTTGQGYAVGTANSVSVRVLDNDPTTVALSRSGSAEIAENGGSANLTVSLGRNLRAGETVTAPLAVTGQHITAEDYGLSLNAQSRLNLGVSLTTGTPHSPTQPAVVFDGHDSNSVRHAYLTLTAIDNGGTEPDTETLNVTFGSDSRSVTSNLDSASGTGTAGTSSSGSVSIDIVSGAAASDPPPPPPQVPTPIPPSTPTPPPVVPPPIVSPQDDHGDQQATATTIEVNSQTNGRIETDGDIDYFQFTIRDQSDTTITTTGIMDTICALENSEGIIARNDDDGVGRNCLISGELIEGSYWIAVRGYSSTTGSYGLSLSAQSQDVSDSKDFPQELTINSSFQSRLGRSDDIDHFTVSADSPGNLAIYSKGSTDTIGCIFEEIVSDKANWHCDDDNGEGRNFLHEISVDQPTDYILSVHGFNGAIGDYELVVDFSANEINDLPIEQATLISSTADNWIYQIPSFLARDSSQLFRIEISHDKRFVVHTTGDIDTRARLFRAPQLHDPILTANGGGEGQNLRIETNVTAGTYYIALSGQNSVSSGEYRLHLELGPSD